MTQRRQWMIGMTALMGATLLQGCFPAQQKPAENTDAPKAPAKPKRTRRKKVVAAEVEAEAAPEAVVDAAPDVPVAENADAGEEGEGENGEPRRGWWQRTFGQ